MRHCQTAARGSAGEGLNGQRQLVPRYQVAFARFQIRAQEQRDRSGLHAEFRRGGEVRENSGTLGRRRSRRGQGSEQKRGQQGRVEARAGAEYEHREDLRLIFVGLVRQINTAVSLSSEAARLRQRVLEWS